MTARKVRTVSHVWVHPQYGELTAIWNETEPGNPHLIAIQPSLFTPADEVTELVRLARLQGRATPGG